MITINKPREFKLKQPDQWFKSLLDQMDMVENKKYKDIIIFSIGDVHYMEYYKDGRLFYDYSKIYMSLEKFDLGLEQINDLVRKLVMDKFEINIRDCQPFLFESTNLLELFRIDYFNKQVEIIPRKKIIDPSTFKLILMIIISLSIWFAGVMLPDIIFESRYLSMLVSMILFPALLFGIIYSFKKMFK